MACLAFIFLSLYQLRMAYEFQADFTLLQWHGPRFFQYGLFFIAFAVFYLFFVYKNKIFNFRASLGLMDELFKTLQAHSYALLISIGISFLLNFDEYSRLVIVSFWVTALMGSFLLRGSKRMIYFSLARKGYLTKNVIIVGAGKIGKLIMDEFGAHPWLGYRVLGYVDDQETSLYDSHQCLGTTSSLKSLVTTNHVDEIIITIPSQRTLVDSIIKDLRKISINIKIVPDMFNLMFSTVQIGNINALPVMTLIRTPMQGLGYALKRIFDVVLSSIGLLIMSPLLGLVAILIKLEDGGPVLYKQIRIGKNGKMFGMYKFRSMVRNAEQLLPQLSDKNEMDGAAFKIKNDPRVTRIGRILRKYSIDELPQLLNVLKGNMSLVGPRPPLPNEVDLYGDWEWRRLEVLPGITGLWQVSGRSDLSFQQWINLDIYYIENWSLGLDVKIMLKTIPVVIKGEGAY
ncbi:sugar transferase [Paenibacillus antri]|uniref:Sugar transferase n=2 Tax=Paenibacillus antri TaxID=2582848 RepID=A0A5R9GFW5_9BACL|nr:sugar transferase [Paenibacillus antri]